MRYSDVELVRNGGCVVCGLWAHPGGARWGREPASGAVVVVVVVGSHSTPTAEKGNDETLRVGAGLCKLGPGRLGN